MKTVVFDSPWIDVGHFPDAHVTLKRGTPTPVTDEQAAILLKNPCVKEAAASAPVETQSQPPAPIAARPVTSEE